MFFGKPDSLYLLIMESSIWQKLVSTWENDFYASFLLELLQFFTLISALLTFRLEKLRILILLFIVTTLMSHPFYFSALFNLHEKKDKIYIWIYCQIVSSVFEFIAYYYFFFKILRGYWIKQLMRYFIYIIVILLVVYCIFSFNRNTSSNQLVKFFYYLITVDVLFIIIPAFAYYVEIFKKPEIPNLFKNNPFLITTGIFFPYITIIPFLILADFLNKEHKQIYNIFFSVHYVLFSFLFIVLIRAFICKKSLTK